MSNEAIKFDDDIEDLPDSPEEIALAQKQGWRREEEWDDEKAEREGRKRPTKFVSAREFNARIERQTPILRERLRNVEKQNEILIAKVTDMSDIIVDQRERGRQAVIRSYQKGREDIEQEMRDAVIEGDLETYDAKKMQLAQLDQQAYEMNKPQEPKPQERTTDPVIDSWRAQNPWFDSSYILNAAMISDHATVKQEFPGMSLWDQFEVAKRRVQTRYPELFGANPARDAPSSVSQPTGERRNMNGPGSFESLPQADRDAFERQRKAFAQRKPPVIFTQAEFMKEYVL